MADFPGKVSTQTSSQEPQRSFGIPLSVDMNFIKGIPGILLLAEIVSWKNCQLYFPCFVICLGVFYLTSFLLLKTISFSLHHTLTPTFLCCLFILQKIMPNFQYEKY